MNDAAALLAGLDPDQYRAVTSDAAPLAVLAGAGAGKTRVLTRRIAWRVRTDRAAANRILAVTFTRKAAGELATRLRGLGVDGLTSGTFHAVAFAQLRQWSDDHNRPAPKLIERKARLIAPHIGEGSNNEITRKCSIVASEIEWAKARVVAPERYESAAIGARRRPGMPLAQVADVFKLYERDRRKKRLLDYDDLILSLTHLIETDTEFASVQRWRFRHLYVDEFQDVTPAQLALVRSWLGDRHDLCVVGDPDQAIYAFAGSDPDLLRVFEEHFPGGESIQLHANHRSTAPILTAARAVLAPDAARTEPTIPDERRQRGETPTITRYATDTDEAEGIAMGLMRAHRDGRTWSNLSVLVRTNGQIPALERACTTAGIPLRVRSASAFLSADHTKAVFSILDDLARAAPGRAFAEHLTDLLEMGTEGTPEERDVVAPLVDLAHEYLASEGGRGSVAGFRTFTSTALRRDRAFGAEDAVEIATFHRAKGLEWDVVFVAGLEDGLVPISYAQHPAALEEERRLAYVAFTRAREVLHLSWAESRTFGYRTSERQPSPWIDTIQAATGAAAREEADLTVLPPADHIAALRESLGGPAAHDAAKRRHALIEWRARHARAVGVVPHVIVADRVLVVLAEEAPDSPAGLIAAGVDPDTAQRVGAAIVEVLLTATA